MLTEKQRQQVMIEMCSEISARREPFDVLRDELIELIDVACDHLDKDTEALSVAVEEIPLEPADVEYPRWALPEDTSEMPPELVTQLERDIAARDAVVNKLEADRDSEENVAKRQAVDTLVKGRAAQFCAALPERGRAKMTDGQQIALLGWIKRIAER